MEVKNVRELLESQGLSGETPYRWARALYKYIDCGPSDIYYSDIRTLGTIVEGSDVELGPYTFRFPFDPDSFGKTVERRDNSRWFSLIGHGAWITIRETWGEVYWIDDTFGVSERIKRQTEAHINLYDYDDYAEHIIKRWCGYELWNFFNNATF